MAIEQVLLEVIKQGGALAVAVVIVVFYRHDSQKRVEEICEWKKKTEEWAIREREDKQALLKAYTAAAEAIARNTVVIENLQQAVGVLQRMVVTRMRGTKQSVERADE
jgi:SpoU rRNA methylase family enzyme